MGMEQI